MSRPDDGKRFEWPLLVFPVALLAALVILYVVNRSLQEELPNGPVHREGAAAPARTTARQGSPDLATPLVEENAGPATRAGGVPQQHSEPRSRPDRSPEQDEERALEAIRHAAIVDATAPPADAVPLEGTALVIATLRDAVQQQDHARIKQCLDELVALGDQVVGPLTELIMDGDGEAGIWAAEALARIGSPVATNALLDRLSRVKEGSYKEALAKRVSGISNHESWPVLLNRALETGDAAVLRAAGTALSRMADTPIVDEIVARYEAAASERDVARLTDLIGNIRSSGATDALLSLAGDVSAAPRDGLARAAVDALGKIGDPQAVSYLLRKLEASPPGEGGYLVNTIAQIDRPDAHAPLLYAAAGNKEVSAEHGRTAAIHALKNFPDEQTCQLLEQIIAQEENTAVVTAALRTIEDIHRTSPHVVAKAESSQKKGLDLPVDPLKK